MDNQFLEKEHKINDRMMMNDIFEVNDYQEIYDRKGILTSKDEKQSEFLQNNKKIDGIRNRIKIREMQIKDVRSVTQQRQEALSEKEKDKIETGQEKLKKKNTCISDYAYTIIYDNQNLESRLKKEKKSEKDKISEEEMRKISEYTPDILGKFTTNYLACRFEDAKKELIMIQKYAAKIKNGEITQEQIKNKNYEYDFLELAERCQEMFENSMAQHGLKFKNGISGEIVLVTSSERQIAVDKKQEKRDLLKEVFVQGKYKQEKRNIIENENAMFEAWNEEMYSELFARQGASVSIEQMKKLAGEGWNHGTPERDLLSERLLQEHEQLAHMIAIREYKIEKRMKEIMEKLLPDDSNEVERVRQLTHYVSKLYQDKYMIESIFKTKQQEQELNIAQKEYLSATYGYKFAELEWDYKVKCMRYKESEKADFESISETELQQKINHMCKTLKTGMGRMELVALQEELNELSNRIQEILKERKSPEVPMKENDLEELKMFKVITYAQKARAAVLLTGCKQGYISIEDLSETEINEIKGSGKIENIRSEDILKYAKKKYAVAHQVYQNKNKEIFERKNVYADINEVAHHPDKYKDTETNSKHMQFTSDYWTNVKAENPAVKVKAKTERIEKIKELIKLTKDKEELKILNERLREERETTEFAEIMQRIVTKYWAHGKKGNLDTFVRDMKTLDSVPAFNEMDDKQMLEMMSLLAAGTAERKVEDEDVKMNYQEKNMKGLTIVKEKLFIHFTSLYKKYGVDFPEYEYLYENFKEIHNDLGASIMQTAEMLRNFEGLFDEKKPEDRLLSCLIRFYAEFGLKFLNVLCMKFIDSTNPVTYDMFNAGAKGEWKKIMINYADEVKACDLTLIQ